MTDTQEQEPQMVAWSVEITGMTCIVFAFTKAGAKWQAVKAHREAGMSNRGTWPSCIAVRAERFDRSPLKDKAQQTWTEDAVLNSL